MKNCRYARLSMCVLVATLLLTSGCWNREPERKQTRESLRIGFALADLNRDGNKTIKRTVEERKQDEGVDITWVDAKNDPAGQDKQLDELIDKKVKAVVLQPVDPGRAPDQVEKLARAGIKVVVLENLPPNTPVDAYIASDHAMAGQLQARFITEALRRAEEMKSRAGQGVSGGMQQSSEAVDYSTAAQLPERRPLNVVILQGDPRDQLAVSVTEAVRNALQERTDIKIIGVYEHPRWDPATVPATLGEIFARNEQVDAVVANDSALAMAAVEHLKAGGYDKNVLTVGLGADERSSLALTGGEHDAEVDVNPEMLGQYSLEAARDLARSGAWQYDSRVVNGDYSVPARIVPVKLVTAKNSFLLEKRWKDLKKERQQNKPDEQTVEDKQREGGQQEEEQSQGGEQQGGAQSQDGEQQGGKDKTMLRITTQDGKTVEVEIDGAVKKIESEGGGQQGQQGQQQGQGGGQ